MLNDLVNSTGPYCSSYNKIIDSCVCDDIAELFECYNEVKSQSDENSCALQKLSTYINCDNGNIDANDISASSASINGLISCGIVADSVTSNSVCAKNKLETKCVESESITAGNLNVLDISANNLTGLSSLTVEGQATVDKLQTDEIETAGKVTASSIETTTAKVTTLESTNIDASNISAVCIDTDSIDAEDAVIENACIGKLSTSCFSSDEIETSKINSTSLSVPKLETSGGITGKGTIDVTSSVWKEIRIPLFTGTIQFYTNEWKVTVNGGREFIWEDESLDHLKFISNDGETVIIAVDWDGEVYYTYNVAKNEPIVSLVDNTGHIQANDHTYIMQDSGIKRGTVLIYQDKEFTNQGLTILGKVKASNLEITCGESIECLSVGNLCVTNSIISNNPIEVDICAKSFCVSSPCTYIDNCLYADHLEANCICSNGHLWANNLYFDMIQVVNCAESPKSVVVYENGLLCDSYKVCVDDDTVYSQKSCACDFYGNLHGKADNTCCFDGRLFCDACFEILSGKACTAGLADNSCCFEGRNFSNACLEILSGKACTAELADMAKKVCIGCCWAGTEPCWGYIPFTDPYNGCIFQARMDTGYGNPLVAYNEYGLLCMEIRGCVCINDDPLIANRSIATRYLKADDMRVCEDALITNLCSCNSYTERLCVNKCAKFRGPVYFYGNIYQCGSSYCTHAQNIYTCSDTITMREGADFAGEAQIKVLKYDGTNNGIIQLGTDGTLRIGDETNCQPVLTRSEEANICDGHVLVWDATARCAKDGGDAIVTCDYVHCVGKECAKASCCFTCWLTDKCDYWNRAYTQTMDRICYNCLAAEVCITCLNSYSHADTVGTCCFQKACCCAINMDNRCLACAYNCTDKALSCACSFAVSCGHEIGTACKNAATATKADCYGKSTSCVACADLTRKVDLESYTATNKRFIYIGQPDAAKNIGCNANLWYCPTCNIMVMGDKCGSTLCLVGTGSCCMSGICTKLNPKIVFSTTDSQCGCLQYSQYDGVHPGAGLCWQTNTPNTWFQTDCIYANKYLDKDGNNVGTICKNAACAFAVSCGHEIGTSCKNAATATKADCYGKSTSCVACADLTRKVILGAYSAPQKRFIYFGNPADGNPIGCHPNFWFCPTCNIIAMTGGETSGSTLCLVGKGSCCMSGECSKENPKIVFSDTGGYCGCLQLSRYTDTIHSGFGLCWMTNYQQDSWIQTDCFYAKCYLDSNGNCLAGYTATVASPAGTTRYVLLDLGKEDTMVDFQVYNSHGTIIKTTSESAPAGNIYQSNSYGINGYCMVDAVGSCVWLRFIGWRALNLWGSYPIKVLSNTTTNPGCTWTSPTILPTCSYVSAVGAECKSAACTYASSVGGQCKSASCTYADTVAFCNVNTCKGIGVMGVARGVDAQCWTKAGYWAYMTTKDGPNCCWNHVIKTDWATDVDVWSSGISIPTYNAPQNGIHYKVRCCGGTTGWTLVPDITCVQNVGLSCRNLAEACACSFAATCAQAVAPETSTFAKCYGNSTNCVAYANQVRVGVSSGNAYYKIPFTGTTGTTTSNQSLYIDNANAFPSYNPSTNVFCGYTVCVAQTLAVRNANGGFRLGNYCIYIG